MPRRPGLNISSRRDSWPRRPRTSRTQHSCGLRRPRSAEQGGCARDNAPAGPDTHSFPAPWPFKFATGSLLERSVQLGRAHGRGGSSGDCSCLRAALRRGSGGPWAGASAPSPLPWDSFTLSPFVPRPTSAAWPIRAPRCERSGHGRRPIKASGCRGCGPGHPKRTRGPVTIGCHRWGWPPRLPLGSGSPAAPCFSASRSG